MSNSSKVNKMTDSYCKDQMYLAFTSCDIRIGERSYIPMNELTSGDLSSVDKESYRPNSVTTRNQLLSPSGVVRVGVYDFPDGKDSGARPIRRLDLDRVQVDAIIKQKLSDAQDAAAEAVNEQIKAAVDKTAAEQAKQARIAEAVETSKAVAKASKDV